MTVVDRMETLADEWHDGVERKGKGHVPYIEHPRDVVRLLREWGMTDAENPVALSVAWGHDLIEDTKVPAASILHAGKEYGMEILTGILHVTFSRDEYPGAADHDAADLMYMERIAKCAPPEILMVKLADRVCNTRDFAKAPPKHEPTKAARYLHEADPVLRAASRVPEKFRAAVEATLSDLKREVGYAEWTHKVLI